MYCAITVLSAEQSFVAALRCGNLPLQSNGRHCRRPRLALRAMSRLRALFHDGGLGLELGLQIYFLDISKCTYDHPWVTLIQIYKYMWICVLWLAFRFGVIE